ncbi:MAG: TOBE domain-containing protein [Rhodopseudomonas palustris]|nr:TOBE domain-containing protein [Rhodopseudomonas palustris]
MSAWPANSRSRSTILNALPTRIVSATPLNSSEMVVVLALGSGGDGARLLARVTRRSWISCSSPPASR